LNEAVWGTLLDPLASSGKSWEYTPPGQYLVAKHFAEICVCLEFSLNSVQIYVIRLISWRGSGIRLEDAKRLFD
jgi:hypothetical protein